MCVVREPSSDIELARLGPRRGTLPATRAPMTLSSSSTRMKQGDKDAVIPLLTAPALAHDTISISDSVDDPSPSGSFDWSAEPLRLCPTGCATVLDDDPSPSGSVDWSAEPLRLCRDADAVRHVDPSPVSVTVQPPSEADTCTDTEPRSSDVSAFSHQDRDIETQDTLLRLVSETFDSQDTQRERQLEQDRLHLLEGARCRSRSRSPLCPATDSDNDIGDHQALRLSCLLYTSPSPRDS